MRSSSRAFTLIELMIVVAVLTLLIAMLVPTMSAALEQSRIVSCGSVLHHIANALHQYVTENNNQFPYEAANNDFRPMIGAYLGLGQFIVPYINGANRGVTFNTTWDKLKPFQCPTGAGLGANARADGNEAVQSYWLNNWYISQYPLSNYFPNLQIPWSSQNPNDPNDHNYNSQIRGGPSHIGLLCEEWAVDTVGTLEYPLQPSSAQNITYGVVGSGFAQPYSTHYRYGAMGVMGIGRNMLFADWHIIFRKCTYSAATDHVEDTTYWSDSSANAVQVQTTLIDRGNEAGESFQLQTNTGATYWGWRPIMYDPDMAWWWGP
jgi:prepilin-type N-terminal cleavage/methylation domain-containing protein